MKNVSHKLIDIGANLTDPMFQGVYREKKYHDSDFDLMLKRSFSRGVQKIIVTAGSLEESKNSLELTEKYENLYTTVGVHPTRCDEFKENPKEHLSKLLKQCEIGMKNKKVVAIGEIGLDYDRLQFCEKETQLKYFDLQFELANQTKLPLFLHNRNSTLDLVSILKQNKNKFSKGVVHSFDGSENDLKAILEFDNLFIGINGCSLKTEENLNVMSLIPKEKLMIETDCPYCQIRPSHASSSLVKTKLEKEKDPKKFEKNLRVKGRNEPNALINVLEVISNCREENIEELGKQIYQNTISVFFPQESE
eukprot:gene2684-3880_t